MGKRTRDMGLGMWDSGLGMESRAHKRGPQPIVQAISCLDTQSKAICHILPLLFTLCHPSSQSGILYCSMKFWSYSFYHSSGYCIEPCSVIGRVPVGVIGGWLLTTEPDINLWYSSSGHSLLPTTDQHGYDTSGYSSAVLLHDQQNQHL